MPVVKVSSTDKAVKNNMTMGVSKSTRGFKSIIFAQGSKAVSWNVKGVELDTSRFYYNQSPVESPNGSLKVFTLASNHEYVLLSVYLDGIRQTKNVDYTESSSSTFTFTNAPDADEVIKIDYIKT
jgi:hypothetical protein